MFSNRTSSRPGLTIQGLALTEIGSLNPIKGRDRGLR